MKRFLIGFSLFALFGSVALFAAGDPETAGSQGPREQHAYGDCCAEDWDLETITVTGSLKLNTDNHPELVAADATYELMYPHYLSYDIEVEDGETISVEGVLMPGPWYHYSDILPSRIFSE